MQPLEQIRLLAQSMGLKCDVSVKTGTDKRGFCDAEITGDTATLAQFREAYKVTDLPNRIAWHTVDVPEHKEYGQPYLEISSIWFDHQEGIYDV